MRYRSKISKQEAAKELAKLVENTNRDLLYLRNQCAIHVRLEIPLIVLLETYLFYGVAGKCDHQPLEEEEPRQA